MHKPIEDAISGLLAEELRKRGVEALPVSIPTPHGSRKPDLLCKNGGIYPVEAKFAENKLIDAIAKIQNDYLKFHKVLGISGGFALLYPEELSHPMPLEVVRNLAYRLKFKVIAMFPPDDVRKNFAVYEGTLPEVADILARHILTPPEYVEPSIKFMIKSLRDGATLLVNGLMHLSGAQIEDVFGGKHVFRNVLQYDEGKYPIENMRMAAAYLLVNQLLFYHVLSRRRADLFPEIDVDGIRAPSDLRPYFRRVLDVNYQVVFSYDVASRIPPKFTGIVKTLISVIQGLSPEKVGGDLLGTIFHDLVPFDVRKAVAAFYTNVEAAELLANLAIDRYDVKVADFAVGSGGLLVASYRRKRELLERERAFTGEDHRRFVEEELLGVDVMPFAASVAACHLALQSPEHFTDKVQIAVWDSTDLAPSRVIPSIAELRIVLSGQADLEAFIKSESEIKGVVSLREGENREIKLETYDVVIMNPPFTRQERLPEDYKTRLFERFRDYRGYLHGQLGYYGYFVLLADKFLKENGRMALVLPATALRLRSSEGIRRLWSDMYHIEYIVTTWRRSAFSESARFREVLLVARKSKPAENAKTVIAVLKKLPSTLAEAREMAEAIKCSQADWEDDRMLIRIYSYSKLRADINNWFKYLSVGDPELVGLLENLLKSGRLTTFNSLLTACKAGIVRGVETGRGGKVQALTITRAERAIKREDVWIMRRIDGNSIVIEDRHTKRILKVPLQAARPALRRISLISKIDVTDNLDYVIVNTFPQISEFTTTVITEFKPPQGFWDRWRSYVEERLSHLVLMRRADLSAPGTRLLAFYSEIPMAPPGVAWSIKISDVDAKILALWLNSSFNILQILLYRKETRGAFLQLDKYVLKHMLVPDLTKLSEDDVKFLTEIFSRVKNVEFPSILDQLKMKYEARRLIDEAWLRILDYKGDVNTFLGRLYELLAKEIELLKSLMKEAEE